MKKALFIFGIVLGYLSVNCFRKTEKETQAIRDVRSNSYGLDYSTM